MQLETFEDVEEALKNGPYAWPGGYPCFFVTNDGAALSFKTVEENIDDVREAMEDPNDSSGWRVEAVDVNWEDPNLIDDHSGERIESAYAEDDDED